MQLKRLSIVFLMTAALARSASAAGPTPADQCRFIGVRDFTAFNVGMSTNIDEISLISPVFKAPIAWNELVASWNAVMPTNAWLKVEAMGIYPDHTTRYYTMGVWSANTGSNWRGSVRDQADADGRVDTDTLIMMRPGADVQVRLTLVGPGQQFRPQLKFLGLSFLDNNIKIAALPPNRAAWGKAVPTPEFSQHAYSNENGWCSPASLAMVLDRWGHVLHQPDLNVSVPAVAAGVYDPHLDGTGNWSFNAAYAGGFPGMRAYVTRFSDISEIEDWIADGIPVIISAPWHLLESGRKDTGSGHLAVCIGFTRDGSVIVNDPAGNPHEHQAIRHIYDRQNVVNAWSQSRNIVYLVYPETAQIPADHYGHWENP
jgi:hypothetical protein